MTNFSNRLAKENSPYLLQHAHNPVDWYPWGEEALQKAKLEDKPILVSIGYAACHWCHVMERESFEDAGTAAFMNEHFVNIKIDREERPDLDHIYMDAVQAIAGQGGWPLNVFLTPDLKPFYGGTYFPPKRAFNRSSWLEVLAALADAFKNRRNEIEEQAANLTSHLEASNNFGINEPGHALSRDTATVIYKNLMKTADKTEGGFGKAPKFPQSFSIQYLLQYYYHTGEEPALNQALLSLDKMAMGGIYDHLGGGFARYSTDTEWLAPHFEKMLYDNALLVPVYCDAWQLSRREIYRQTVFQTLEFTRRELLSPDNGFYSALDADSEGEEGKFYVWKKEEIDEILGEEASLFSAFYDVTPSGNWEHRNILRMKTSLEAFASSQGLDPGPLAAKLADLRKKFLEKREQRPRPLLDDKILLGWNALMNLAFTRAYACFGNPQDLVLARQNMDFLLDRFVHTEEGKMFHTFKEGLAKYPAFLEDYAFLIRALIGLQEVTGDSSYLEKAKTFMEYVIAGFSDEKSGFFFFTHTEQKDVIVRKKELHDGAVPSANSVMAFNLYYLGMIFDRKEWTERAVKMVMSLENVFTSYPGSFAHWASVYQALAFGIPEIALVGMDVEKKLPELLKEYIPFRILQSGSKEDSKFPLLAGKNAEEVSKIYLCENYACRRPFTTIGELRSHLETT